MPTQRLRGNVKGNKRKRKGRGFSLEEIKLAELDPREIKKLKIIVDKRRKTIREENIKILKYMKSEIK